jgi:hypothetical protein
MKGSINRSTAKGEDKMAPSSMPLRVAGIVTFTLLAATPAFAGTIPATPAPLLGAGVPALAAFAAGYWAMRKRRGG